MQTVIETRSFESSAARAGMTRGEIDGVVAFISANPTAGDLIPGSGGCRKVRFARSGGGKRGGYRIVTYYYDATVPVVLLYALSKSDRESFTPDESKALAEAARRLKDAWRRSRATRTQ